MPSPLTVTLNSLARLYEFRKKEGQPMSVAVKFGYFTLMDDPLAYGARRRDPNHFFHDVMQEAVFATERCARGR